MTYKISHHFCVSAVFLIKIAVALGKHHGTTLQVLSPPNWEEDIARYSCKGLDEALHPLNRKSWLLISGKEEKQINYNTMDHGSTLVLFLTAEMHGAKLACRAHATTRPQQVMLAPPTLIRLHDTSTVVKPVSSRIIIARIGNKSYSEGGAVMRRAGTVVDVDCHASNLARDINLYIYILIRNENGDIETEIAGEAVNNNRLWHISGRFRARAESNNSQIYCLARWFITNDTAYRNPDALRSDPVTLVIEPTAPENCENLLPLWIAIVAGTVGWLIAVVMIGRSLYLCIRDRRNETTPQNSTQAPNCSDFTCGGDAGSNSSSDYGPGATVLPMHTARNLATTNVKLTHAVNPNNVKMNHNVNPNNVKMMPNVNPRTAPPVEEYSTYCNVQEMNSLLRRKQF